MSDDDKEPQADEALADEWAAALEQQEEEEDLAADPTEVAEFQALEEESVSSTSTGDVNMDAILDVPVTISMEIGRTKIAIRNLLQLNQGSVVELDRLAGEPMDVLVNGTLIAQGEVVVVNEKFGIRLTDIISPSERVKRLQ
ncbi:MAG: flagellar motor switch protein FliN [Candidatus Polarisedimenticolaceae bacterium]|nr:flagellar motor switch protein FliN [Candidatus Polarisedimenticolaceae bacterium]